MACAHCFRQAVLGNRHAPLDERPDLLCLGNGRNDAAGNLGSPGLVRINLFASEHQSGREIPQEGPLV